MTTIYFTLVAIGLYFVADRILDALERRDGRRFAQRSLVFFVLLLVLSLATFAVLRRILAPA